MSQIASALETVRADPGYRVLSRICAPAAEVGFQTMGESIRVAVVDFETTGMDWAHDRVIEIGLVVCDVCKDTGAIKRFVTEYSSLNDPGMPIPPSATAVNGITDAMVAGHHIDADDLSACLAGVDLVIAHNAAFDRPFAEVLHAEFASIPWACSFAEIDWAAANIESRKLDYIAYKLGYFYDAHRALVDCYAVFAVLTCTLPTIGRAAFTELLKSMQEPSYTFAAVGAAFDKKDLLKARGYQWNADEKFWHTRVFGADPARAEVKWLAEQVYAGSSRATIHKLSAADRYSVRVGEKIR